MIKSRKELEFYIMADRIMAGRNSRRSLKEFLKGVFTSQNVILDYLRYMRKVSYYKSKKCRRLSFDYLRCLYAGYKYRNLGLKLGFSIGYDVFGYGLLIPHYGTIVVNSNVRVGNYAVLHTCTCIGGSNKIMGDGLYLSTGSQIMGNLTLGNNVSVSAHSLVNKSFGDNVLLVGSPALVKVENYSSWYDRYGDIYKQRVLKVEKLKREMNV